MPNALYNQLNGNNPISSNPILNRIKQFRSTFSGDPKQMVQSMVNSGRISQSQINQYVQQANEIYKLLR